MRARVHDETALLPDQSVHIRWIQVDFAGPAGDRLPEWHRESLFEIDFGPGSFTGVDAAVPDLTIARQLRGRQQFTVGHAAGLGQVGGVVPLAHAVGPQAEQDRVDAALQAQVLPCRFFFFVAQRRRPLWHDDLLAEFLERELLVEATHRCDRFQQALGLGALGFAAARTQQCACFPVDPGRVLACFVTHGVDGLQHQRPLRDRPGSQCGACLPGQHLVAQIAVARDLGEVIQRVRPEFSGRLPADDAPHPVALLCRQLRGPFAFQQNGGALDVGGRQFDQGQRDQLAARFGDRQQAAGQELRRAVVQVVERDHRSRRCDFHRCRCRPWPIGFGRQPGLAPRVVQRQAAAAMAIGHQRPRGQSTTVVRFTLREPVTPNLLGQIGRGRGAIAQVLGQQRITAHFPIVVHPVTRVFGGERRPVAPLPQHQQPVVAHPVFLVAAGVAAHEVLHFLRAGDIEAGSQFPIGGPGLKGMAAGCWQQLAEAGPVSLPESLAHFKDDLVAGLGWGLTAQRHREQCQNRS